MLLSRSHAAFEAPALFLMSEALLREGRAWFRLHGQQQNQAPRKYLHHASAGSSTKLPVLKEVASSCRHAERETDQARRTAVKVHIPYWQDSMLPVYSLH